MLKKLIKKLSKEFKSNKFCYQKVGRAITIWGVIEKHQIFETIKKFDT